MAAMAGLLLSARIFPRIAAGVEPPGQFLLWLSLPVVGAA